LTAGQSIFAPPNAAKSKNYTSAALSHKIKLGYLDVLFRQKVLDRCRFHLALQGGVQFAHIDFKEKLTLSASPHLVNTHSELWGIGPEIGAEFSYCLSDCFSIVGKTQVTILASKRRASFMEATEPIINAYPYDTKNEPYWRSIPGSDLRFGLSYETPVNRCLGNCTLNLELGYEFIVYYNGVERICYVDDGAENTSFNEMMTLTLHGPYVHLGVKY
jgi:hypothetical protein